MDQETRLLTKLELLQALSDKDRFLATQKLAHFAKYAWNIVEPNRQYIHGWHIDAICDHLEAVTRGDISKLVINMPPRHMKSLLVSVFWPAWVWLTMPHKRWIFASYALSLSVRDSVKCRRVIDHPAYKALEPPFKLESDQNEKLKYETNKTGFRLATSFGGSGTGEGGDFVCIDDPLKADEGLNEKARLGVNRSWDNTMSSRVNNPKQCGRVIMMQRLHYNDLSGHVLEKGDWEHLCLPAEYSQKVYPVTSIGFKDPRKEIGEKLWPENFGDKEIAEFKRDLGSVAAAAQLQQDPSPEENAMFRREWWKLYKQLPDDVYMKGQFWDCAQKVGLSNDWSVCATWCKTPTGLYVTDVWRARVTAPDLERAAKSLYNEHEPDVVVIEDASSGASLIQYLQRFTDIPVIPVKPKLSKEVRAAAVTPTVESGNCHLLEGAPWTEKFIMEHERFPFDEHDDQVDTTTMAIEYFKTDDYSGPRIRTL